MLIENELQIIWKSLQEQQKQARKDRFNLKIIRGSRNSSETWTECHRGRGLCLIKWIRGINQARHTKRFQSSPIDQRWGNEISIGWYLYLFVDGEENTSTRSTICKCLIKLCQHDRKDDPQHVSCIRHLSWTWCLRKDQLKELSPGKTIILHVLRESHGTQSPKTLWLLSSCHPQQPLFADTKVNRVTTKL